MLGKQKRFLQSLRVNKVRVVKPSIDNSNSFIVVPLKEKYLRPLRFPRFFFKLSQFQHPERSIHSYNFKRQMVLERHTRLLQFLRVNNVRAVKSSIDDGNSFIVVPLKQSA